MHDELLILNEIPDPQHTHAQRVCYDPGSESEHLCDVSHMRTPMACLMVYFL